MPLSLTTEPMQSVMDSVFIYKYIFRDALLITLKQAAKDPCQSVHLNKNCIASGNK